MANPKSTRSTGTKRPDDHVPNRTEHDKKAPDKGESSATNPTPGGATSEPQENRNHPKDVKTPETKTEKAPWGQG